MLEIIGSHSECFSTLGANIWFLSCVQRGVNLQILGTNEIFKEKKWNKNINDTKTYLKSFEGFSTNFARKISHSVVNIAHMACPLLVRPKRFPTFMTKI